MPAVFAANLKLESQISAVSIWESFDITVSVDESTNSEVSIDTIGWIENFSFLGQSSQQRYVNINGEVESQNKLLITLIAKTPWVFTLWPVSASFSWDTIESNTIEITVWEASIKSAEGEGDVDILDIFEGDDEKMYFNWHPLIFIVFFSIFYLVVSRFFRKGHSHEQESSVKPESPTDILISKLKKLKRSAAKVEKSDFYWSCNDLIRDFLKESGYKNAPKMTLKEIKKIDIKNKKLLAVFEESYRREFDNKDDTIDERKKLIDTFIKLL